MKTLWQRQFAARLVAAIWLVLALAGAAAQSGRADTEPRAITPRGPLPAEEQAQVDLFRRVSPSVVHITTLEVGRDLFSRNVLQVPRGTGTGFVWDREGHIVTNFHVIQEGNAARVTLADQTTWRGVALLDDVEVGDDVTL